MRGAADDWQHLRGSWVELRADGRLVRTGEVEDVAADSSVLWLRYNGAHGRQMIAAGDGYDIIPSENRTPGNLKQD